MISKYYLSYPLELVQVRRDVGARLVCMHQPIADIATMLKKKADRASVFILRKKSGARLATCTDSKFYGTASDHDIYFIESNGLR